MGDCKIMVETVPSLMFLKKNDVDCEKIIDKIKKMDFPFKVKISVTKDIL